MSGNLSEEYSSLLLKNDLVSATIVPRFGGSLQGLVVGGLPILKGSEPSIKGYSDYLAFCRSGILCPFPNRIAEGQYSYNGQDYCLPINETGHGHAIHGLVFDKELRVINHSQTHIELNLDYPGTPGFPFCFDCTAVYSLLDDGIRMGIRLNNTASQSFPFGLGWHPYFLASQLDDCYIEMQTSARYITDDRMIPLGPEPHRLNKIRLNQPELDDAFLLDRDTVKFVTPEYTLEMSLPESSYLQLYIPEDRRSVAIEPMSCIANAFNNGIGLKELADSEQFNWEITVRVSLN